MPSPRNDASVYTRAKCAWKDGLRKDTVRGPTMLMTSCMNERHRSTAFQEAPYVPFAAMRSGAFAARRINGDVHSEVAVIAFLPPR